MSGELPHNLTHQDQRRNVWSPDSEGVIFLTVIVKPYHWSYIQPPTSSNDPMYTGSRCFELETDGAIVDPMVEEDT